MTNRLIRPAHTLLFAALLCCALAFTTAAAAEPDKTDTPRPSLPGYKDSPLIPGTTWHVHDPDRPHPPIVQTDGVPSDAVALFNGTDLSRWQASDWKVQDGVMIAGSKNITSKDSLGDIQLHIEWCIPELPASTPAGNRGNSGVFLMGLYELQIFDSHGTDIYADGQAGALYGQMPPQVNASRKPGEWQTYEIIFTAPRFKDGNLEQPARLTALHNGVLILNHVEVLGATAHRALPKYKPHTAALPLVLQAHGCPVRFRNIWIRPLKTP